jgi:hypothetical protein
MPILFAPGDRVVLRAKDGADPTTHLGTITHLDPDAVVVDIDGRPHPLRIPLGNASPVEIAHAPTEENDEAREEEEEDEPEEIEEAKPARWFALVTQSDKLVFDSAADCSDVDHACCDVSPSTMSSTVPYGATTLVDVGQDTVIGNDDTLESAVYHQGRVHAATCVLRRYASSQRAAIRGAIVFPPSTVPFSAVDDLNEPLAIRAALDQAFPLYWQHRWANPVAIVPLAELTPPPTQGGKKAKKKKVKKNGSAKKAKGNRPELTLRSAAWNAQLQNDQGATFFAKHAFDMGASLADEHAINVRIPRRELSKATACENVVAKVYQSEADLLADNGVANLPFDEALDALPYALVPEQDRTADRLAAFYGVENAHIATALRAGHRVVEDGHYAMVQSSGDTPTFYVRRHRKWVFYTSSLTAEEVQRIACALRSNCASSALSECVPNCRPIDAVRTDFAQYSLAEMADANDHVYDQYLEDYAYREGEASSTDMLERAALKRIPVATCTPPVIRAAFVQELRRYPPIQLPQTPRDIVSFAQDECRAAEADEDANWLYDRRHHEQAMSAKLLAVALLLSSTSSTTRQQHALENMDALKQHGTRLYDMHTGDAVMENLMEEKKEEEDEEKDEKEKEQVVALLLDEAVVQSLPPLVQAQYLGQRVADQTWAASLTTGRVPLKRRQRVKEYFLPT